MKHSPFAGAAASFAHLLGRRPAAAKRAEDEDRKDEHCEDESDEETAEDESDEDEKAEDDEDGKRCESDEDKECEDESEDDKKDGKKAKGFAAGVAAERKRCAAIFGSEAAAGLPHVAAQLAFTTDLSAAQAIAVLSGVAVTAAQQGKRSGLSDRMAGVKTPNVGADGGAPAPDADTPAGLVARMKAVYDRAIGQ